MTEPVHAQPIRPVPDQRTRNDQALAADPGASAWVSANAGSGKTHVLATRVVRLLLAGADPSRLLCLTYTRAAAAEMKGRVFARLGAWVNMDDAKLADELHAIEGNRPGRAHIGFARTLFARALETPGGLKIQTVHAFCEALLHRFPLEANIAGHFTLIEPETQALLVGQARRELIAGAGNHEVQDSSAPVIRLLAEVGETGLDDLLDECVARRVEITQLLRNVSPAADRRAVWLSAFGFGDDDTEAAIAAGAWPLPGLTPDAITTLCQQLPAKGAKTASDLAEALAVAGQIADPMERCAALRAVLLTGDGEPRKTSRLASAPARAVMADLAERYEVAAAHLVAIVDRLRLWREIDLTLDALSIADALIGGYETLKRRRGLLDFEDLIVRTANMLARAGASAWVRYKLDQGIDHVLIDEAQDTSPTQWKVIRLLADEFFAGEGPGDRRRTVFAVGDDKQSIYSFQGADPAGFVAERDHFAQVAKGARERFSPVELTASFRSAPAVLQAIDHVFAVPGTLQGLRASGDALVHRSLRDDQAGRVEVWEPFAPEAADPPDDWTAPVDATPGPPLRLAARVANTIDQWLRDGPVLPSTGKPVTPGDILVLIRNRTDGFVPALSRALKDRHIAVAGADRLTMTDHIAISDLLALGRVMLNRADDLSLAALLKGPLFGFDEDQLFALAHKRGSEPIWDRLMVADDAHCRHAAQTLGRWRTLAQALPVHEFYNHVLAADGGRARLTGRLGPETADVLDEFVALTLTFEQTAPPVLESFIHMVEQHAPQIKREMDQARGEVRIMTVHGAKGLEAPVVFVVDRGNAPSTERSAPRLTPVEPAATDGSERQRLVLWRGVKQAQSSIQAGAIAARHDAALGEYRRLLYVGMTRAADWLVVCGYQGHRPPRDATWLSMVREGLCPHGATVETADGTVLRYPPDAAEQVRGQTTRADAARAAEPPIPEGLEEPAPPEPPAPRPLVPTGASGLAIAPETADGAVTRSLLATAGAGPGTDRGRALTRGSAIHTLLQMLPLVPAAERPERARAWCKRLDKGLPHDTITDWLDQVFAILDDERFAHLFASQSIAEVPIMGLVHVGGQERAVAGVIDRLSVCGGDVVIADYKTDRVPPSRPCELSAAHVRQMALYRALVGRLYPGKRVGVVLVFTAGPSMIEVPVTAMDDALAALAQP